MPELPEVETVRRGLAPAIEGRVLTHAETRRGDLRVPFPKDFSARLNGRTVKILRRRGKYLLADLDNGETLVIHLGMSGRISVFAKGARQKLGDYVYDRAPPSCGQDKHDHVVLETDAPARIIFNDHRRFGLMTLIATQELEQDALFKNIGIEPLSDGFHAAYLARAFKAKKTSLKAALLDQRIVAGLGNIYVCEALFRAGLSPKKPAGKIAPQRLDKLVDAIKQVLKEAIAQGGSTLRDHAQATGDPGNFQHHFLVYGRHGKPCATPACRARVRRIVQSGRSSFYCPKCQK